MAEKPILFNGEMVRATLDRRKTQTRRVMKPQPIETHDHFVYDGEIFLTESDMHDHLFHNVYGNNGSPYGSVYGDGTADRLWVRETWAVNGFYDGYKPSDLELGLYSLDLSYKADWLNNKPGYLGKNRPSIFMPRWASRINLQLTDVRIERVRDISHEDAIAEGCNLDWYRDNAGTESLWPCPTCSGWQVHPALGEGLGVTEVDCFDCNTPVKMMKHLWDSINAERGYSWETNPYIWVLEFEILL